MGCIQFVLSEISCASSKQKYIGMSIVDINVFLLLMLFMSFGLVIRFRADFFRPCNLWSSEKVINQRGCNCRKSLRRAGVSNTRDDGHFGLQSCSSLVQASSQKIGRVAEVELAQVIFVSRLVLTVAK